MSSEITFDISIALNYQITLNDILINRTSDILQSVVPTSTKNFPGYVHRFPSLTSSKDARQTCSEYEVSFSKSDIFNILMFGKVFINVSYAIMNRCCSNNFRRCDQLGRNVKLVTCMFHF